MKVWAIADLHLSLGTPNKKMDIFGEQWIEHQKKIQENWKSIITSEDLVLIAGDISWAMTLDQARPDLEWIDALPGHKVIIRGNHDYWWGSIAKVRHNLPSSIQAIQNDSIEFGDITIGGSRLWDTTEFRFSNASLEELSPQKTVDLQEQQKIFTREIERLKLSLRSLNPKANLKIVMTHYPPIGPGLEATQVSALLEEYHVEICVFGHLHGLAPFFGERGGVRYYLTACDVLNFKPLQIA